MKGKDTAKKRFELKNPLIKKLVILGCLMLALSVLLLLRLSSVASEFMTIYIARPLQMLIGGFTSSVVLSFYEILLYVLIAYLIYFLITLIIFLVQKNYFAFGKRFFNTAIVGLIVGIVYCFVAGFGYNRSPLPEYMFSQDNLLRRDEYIDALDYHTERFEKSLSVVERDFSGKVLMKYSIWELTEMLNAQLNSLSEKNDYFGKMNTVAKPMLSSALMSNMGLLGVSFAPTAEININVDAPTIDVVNTVAHEIAHARGVMNEADADLVSCFLLINSNDLFLNYCGYMEWFSNFYIVSFIEGFALPETLQNKIEKLFISIDNDYVLMSKYWDSKQSFLDSIASFFNNLYLQMSGLESGTGSYNPDYGTIIPNPDTGGDIQKPEYLFKPSPAQSLFMENYLKNNPLMLDKDF